MELKGKKINFLGDSITEGVGASDKPTMGYVGRIAEKTGAVCRNYGIGGTQIAYQTEIPDDSPYALNFCDRVEKMDPDADIVVLFGGTNDYGHGDAPLGTMADRTPYTFYGAVHTVCRSLIEKYPTALIVVITPLHRDGEDNPMPYLRTFPTAPLSGYADIIRQVAEYYSLPVLDLYRTSGIRPEIPAQRQAFMPDGLHPNDTLHERIANRLINLLNQL